MNYRFVLCVSLLCCCVSSTAFGYGEDGDIPIPYAARATHLMTNEARTAPRIAMSNCGGNCSEGLECYAEVLHPLYWDAKAFNASQFYAQMMTETKCMQHNSPCTLLSSIVTDFPGKCGGSPSCACKEGKISCGSNKGSASDRLKLFTGSNQYGENICGSGSIDCISRLVNEDNAGNKKCEFTWNYDTFKGNGHRWNLFDAHYKTVSVGAAGYIVQNLGSRDATETNALTAGSHYVKDGKLWFKTHYYSTSDDVKKVVASVGGQCVTLKKTVGLSLKNVVFGTSNISNDIEPCTPYFFESLDASGKTSRFPTTGSLLYVPAAQKDDVCNGVSWTKEGGEASCMTDVICNEGEHEYNGACEPDSVMNCGVHGYNCAEEFDYWGEGTCTDGMCVLTQCNSNGHMKGNVCVANTVQNCGSDGYACSKNVENWSNGYCIEGSCVPTYCKSKYHAEDGACVPNTDGLKCSGGHEYQGACEENTLDNCGKHGFSCEKYIEGWKSGSCDSAHANAPCIPDACADGYALENNKCVLVAKCSKKQHIYNNECEANDTENCGEHGYKCAEHIVGWQSGVCASGQCVLETCVEGSRAEDGVCIVESCPAGHHIYDNTCEPDTIENCGEHGAACTESEGVSEMACEDAKCKVASCKEGWHISDDQCAEDEKPDDEEDKPSGDPEDKPSGDPEDKPSDDPDDKPSGDPDDKPSDDPDDKPSGDPDDKPSGDPEEEDPDDGEDEAGSGSSDACSGSPMSGTSPFAPWLLMGVLGLGLARRRVRRYRN